MNDALRCYKSGVRTFRVNASRNLTGVRVGVTDCSFSPAPTVTRVNDVTGDFTVTISAAASDKIWALGKKGSFRLFFKAAGQDSETTPLINVVVE